MLANRATVKQIKFHLQQEFRKRYPEGESASLVRLVLDHFGYPPSAYLNDPDQVPDPDIQWQIKEIVDEIHTGKPIQYILGSTQFCELKIIVHSGVLIPRPETEEMVYKIRDRLDVEPRNIMDLGTGSGCIALALKNQFPEADVWGLDVSRSALEIARENGRINRLDVTWMYGNLLEEIDQSSEQKFDLVVSNPPYVLNSERIHMSSHVLDFEPEEALFVEDADPLQYYRQIASYCKIHLVQGGVLWLEINERLGSETSRLIEEAGFQQVTLLKDIHEKERFIEARR